MDNIEHDISQKFALINELQIAHDLIVAGLGDLQTIDLANDQYHLSHLLIANGLERLMKCSYCIIKKAQNGKYPKEKLQDIFGNGLENMISWLIKEHEKNNPAEEVLKFLSEDKDIKEVIHILSGFGQRARYYNLDVITGQIKSDGMNPTQEWEKLESKLTYLVKNAPDPSAPDPYPIIHAYLIGKLECFIQAVLMLLYKKEYFCEYSVYSSTFSDFKLLSPDEFGTKDYRKESVKYRTEHKFIERSKEKIKKDGYPHRIIKKSEFPDPKDWPFFVDEVIVENRRQIAWVINIAGFDFGLNGIALSYYKLPHPISMGVQKMGKDISFFINIIQELHS